MTPEKENPLTVDALAGETDRGLDDASGLPSRLDRYSRAHHRALEMSHYAAQRGQVKLSRKLDGCGHWLLFRDYFTVGKVRLHAATFCNKHLLCPLCAMRRGAKQVKAYLDRLQVVLAAQPDLKLSLLTLTVKDGPDLQERFRHLSSSFRTMQQARRSYLRGKGPHVELAKVEGAVGSYEFKRGKNSGQWHPHIHMVVLHRADIDPIKLSAEWFKFTGDSFVVDVTPFHDDQPLVDGFLEVFKYALKFSDMSLDDNWVGFETLSSRRLVFSFGAFRGVDVPDELTDEDLDDLPFVEILFRFAVRSGYSVQKVSSPQRPEALRSEAAASDRPSEAKQQRSTPIKSREKPEAAAKRRAKPEHRTGEDFRGLPRPLIAPPENTLRQSRGDVENTPPDCLPGEGISVIRNEKWEGT